MGRQARNYAGGTGQKLIYVTGPHEFDLGDLTGATIRAGTFP
jgi:hypothetical protein